MTAPVSPEERDAHRLAFGAGMRHAKPTGRWRHRVGWGQCLILQIEEAGIVTWFCGTVTSDHAVRWRDATIADLTVENGANVVRVWRSA